LLDLGVGMSIASARSRPDQNHWDGSTFSLHEIGVPMAACTGQGEIIGLSPQAGAVLEGVGIVTSVLPFMRLGHLSTVHLVDGQRRPATPADVRRADVQAGRRTRRRSVRRRPLGSRVSPPAQNIENERADYGRGVDALGRAQANGSRGLSERLFSLASARV
jgi:hypothetical protein